MYYTSLIKKLLCLLLLLITGTQMAIAQVQWPTPEVEQMYKQARQYHSQGNIRQAITMYQQAIQIAPNVMLLHRELGQAYYVSGSYKEAIETLEPVVKSGQADEETFQVLGASLVASDEKKKARKLFEQGLTRYPHSGLIYHEMGKMYENSGDLDKALETWLKGIEAAPEYHVNYYEAARTYMQTNKPVWALLYGEMFINLEQQTPRANETRKMLLAAYKRLFRPNPDEIPKYGKSNEGGGVTNFEEAVYNTYMKLSPVVADGITTENLTMVRTRFLMDWYLEYANKYPFSLFTRQDDMVRNGYFDIYNQWLFGRAESQAQYDAWTKFHYDAMPDFEEWLKSHPFRPVAGDFYNDKQVAKIFLKK